MDKKLTEIIQKVKKMLKYNTETKNILKTEPYARIRILKDGSFEIMAIYFEDKMLGNVLYIQPLGITLYERAKDNKNKPEQNPYTNIIKYKNYDELLGME